MKGDFGGKINMEFVQSWEDYYLNWEKLKKLLDLNIKIDQWRGYWFEHYKNLFSSKTHIYCLVDGSDNEPNDQYNFSDDSDDDWCGGSWSPSEPDNYMSQDEYSKWKENRIKMIEVWLAVEETWICPSWERLNRLQIDYDSFEIINSDYIKDKNNVYYRLCKIEWVDPEKFMVKNLNTKNIPF